MEFFPEQWIEPGEYSFCGRCGKNESLMRGSHTERPPCIFCKPVFLFLQHPFKRPFYFKYWLEYPSIPFRRLCRCFVWVFSKKHREWHYETNRKIQEHLDERKKQYFESMKIRKERIELATKRRDVLNLPPVYWMHDNA